MKKEVSAYATGKIILIGEHSVVYFKPAIAIPFSGVKIKVTIQESNNEVHLSTYNYTGPINMAPDSLQSLQALVNKIVTSFNVPLDKFNINIESSIPTERGMGSSAAVAAAISRALYKYYEKDLSDKELFDLVNFSEKIIHGNPSGIDSAIVAYEKPLYFIKDQTIETYTFNLSAYLVVADTGDLGNTKLAVSKVKDFIDNNQTIGNDIINDLGSLANKTKLALSSNDVNSVAKYMNKAQEHLKTLGISNEKIDNLVSVARANHALAAKITGGGLGGCIICLTDTKEHAETLRSSLKSNGAKDTWLMQMDLSKEEANES